MLALGYPSNWSWLTRKVDRLHYIEDTLII
jgi:hypothetical protein